MRNYPRHLDWEWIAVDRDGHLATFVTAGEGPAPTTVLDDDYPGGDDLDALVRALPKSSLVKMIVSVPDPASFADLASRGMTVFDWSDVHRTRQRLDAYEVMCRPLRPIHIIDLEPGLADAARRTAFREISFREIATFDPRQFVETIDGLSPR
jgi:hypothetical protein